MRGRSGEIEGAEDVAAVEGLDLAGVLGLGEVVGVGLADEDRVAEDDPADDLVEGLGREGALVAEEAVEAPREEGARVDLASLFALVVLAELAGPRGGMARAPRAKALEEIGRGEGLLLGRGGGPP
ncbi:MAG TPA: hypothetical protein PKW35_26140 [Nannocystaceae bacterium]|nr:hypothetical protein [Nannocystaceae bacterium]